MESVWYKAHTHLTAIEQFIKFDLANTPAESLSVKQVYILNLLYTKDDQHPAVLAKGVGYPQTSFTPVLDVMEGQGLITRANDPNDRRAIIISLTANGKALESVVCDVLASAEKQFKGVVK